MWKRSVAEFGSNSVDILMMLGITVDGSFVLNLGHWNLFEIWFLELEIFMIFIKQVILIRHRSGFIIPITDH